MRYGVLLTAERLMNNQQSSGSVPSQPGVAIDVAIIGAGIGGSALAVRTRLSGSRGAANFLQSWRLDCVPHAEAIVQSTPVSPCIAYPNYDAWVNSPVREGVVLIGDAGNPSGIPYTDGWVKAAGGAELCAVADGL